MSSRRLLGGGGPSGPERSGGAAPVRTGTGDGEAGPCDAVAAPAEQGRFCANSTSDALTEAYLDGTLDAAGAATLAAALHAGGAEAAAIRARLALPGLLAQALDPADGRAVARAVAERLRADVDAPAFRREVRRRLARHRRRQARPALLGWGLAAAALLAVAVGLALVRPAAASPAPWTLLAEGAPERGLAPGSALELPAGAILRAADGTTLVAGGAVRLALGAEPMRIALHAGSIEARVERQPAQHPLVITTAEAEVAVVGTRFRLAREDAGTRLEMSEGCVRLTRLADGGSELVRAGATVAVAARPAEPAWQPLFPAEGLEGWNPEHGRWDNRQGVVTGGAEGAAKARLASRQSLGDCELTCRLRISGGLHQAEIQVGDYNWFVTVPAATTADGWVAVRLSQRQGRLQASADGRALVPEPGAGAAPRRGALAFYAAPGVTVSIADARLRTWP